MRIRLSEFRQIIQKFLSEAMAEIEKEDVDRLRRAKAGYGETEFEEDVDRMRRHAAGYGDSEFDEGLDEPVQDLPANYSPATGDAKNDTWLQRQYKASDKDKEQNRKAIVNPKKEAAGPVYPRGADGKNSWDKSWENYIDKKNTHGDNHPETQAAKQAAKAEWMKDGSPEPKWSKDEASMPPSAPQSSRPKVKDKSQMQGVGPRPTMANAFGNDQQQQQPKREDEELDPNKTTVLTPGQRPDSDKAEKEFMAGQKAKKTAANKEQIKQISHQQQAQMHKDGWKFEKHPSGEGNWSATPPSAKK